MYKASKQASKQASERAVGEVVVGSCFKSQVERSLTSTHTHTHTHTRCFVQVGPATDLVGHSIGNAFAKDGLGDVAVQVLGVEQIVVGPPELGRCLRAKAVRHVGAKHGEGENGAILQTQAKQGGKKNHTNNKVSEYARKRGKSKMEHHKSKEWIDRKLFFFWKKKEQPVRESPIGDAHKPRKAKQVKATKTSRQTFCLHSRRKSMGR